MLHSMARGATWWSISQDSERMLLIEVDPLTLGIWRRGDIVKGSSEGYQSGKLCRP